MGQEEGSQVRTEDHRSQCSGSLKTRSDWGEIPKLLDGGVVGGQERSLVTREKLSPGYWSEWGVSWSC